MIVLYSILALAVVFFAAMICVYLYAKSLRGSEAGRNERWQRAVLDDFGDAAVWQMGGRANELSEQGSPGAGELTRRGVLPPIVMAPMLRGAIASTAAGVLGVLSGRGADAQTDNSPTYGGVTLRPGDVIDFLGGVVTTLDFQRYGHAALYMGVDPSTGQRTFLDFSTTKGGIVEHIFGSSRPFYGRILNENDFLRWNLQSHTSFDVFRLRGSPAIDQRIMFREARRISNDRSWGFSGSVCSSVISEVLTSATGITIHGFSPDNLSTGQFERHPSLAQGQHIDIAGAIRDLQPAHYDVPRRPHLDSPHRDIAHGDSR
ncbi:MAG: hypothetical protein WAU68_12050 [Vitreimonas sp.]